MRTGAKRVLGMALAIALLSGASIASASDGSVYLTADLTGAQEVPAADPDGSGKAKVWIDVDAGEVCFDIKIDNTGTPNRAHIHTGAAGVNGGIVVAFFELRVTDTQPASDPRNDEIEQGRIEDCVPGDPAVLADIVANPHLYYVNLHNARYPGGAVRCQLES